MVFDFDYTMVDANSCIKIRQLLGRLDDDDYRFLRRGGPGLIGQMFSIFELLHKKGVAHAAMKDKIQTIPLTNGMQQLFSFLKSDSFEVVSDANTLFIDWLLEKHGIREQVGHVYSNPAEFDADGKLALQHYHHQDWCDLSTSSLCKGMLYLVTQIQISYYSQI